VSPSVSRYQVEVPLTVSSSSSTSVSQSLSMLSQTSVAPGLTAPSAGLQSVLSATWPGGAMQASTESAALP